MISGIVKRGRTLKLLKNLRLASAPSRIVRITVFGRAPSVSRGEAKRPVPARREVLFLLS